MRTSPPILVAAPMIAPVGFLSMVVEELAVDDPTFDIELDELDEAPDGTLVDVGALLEEVEDVASS